MADGKRGAAAGADPAVTPDGRYLVVRGRLWRRSDPSLPPAAREHLVRDLMEARRAVGTAKRAGDRPAEVEARAAVDRAKRGLGERGPVWWDDGAPDLNRHMARDTPYAGWFAGLASREGVGPAPEAGHAAAVLREPGPDADPGARAPGSGRGDVTPSKRGAPRSPGAGTGAGRRTSATSD